MLNKTQLANTNSTIDNENNNDKTSYNKVSKSTLYQPPVFKNRTLKSSVLQLKNASSSMNSFRNNLKSKTKSNSIPYNNSSYSANLKNSDKKNNLNSIKSTSHGKYWINNDLANKEYLETREKNFSCYFNIDKRDNKDILILNKISDKDRVNNMQLLKLKILNEKQEKAKELKDSFKIIRENISVLKEKIIEENKQQKNVIRAQEKIIYDSLNEYNQLKKLYVRANDNEDYNKMMKDVKEKEKKLLKLQIIANKK